MTEPETDWEALDKLWRVFTCQVCGIQMIYTPDVKEDPTECLECKGVIEKTAQGLGWYPGARQDDEYPRFDVKLMEDS